MFKNVYCVFVSSVITMAGCICSPGGAAAGRFSTLKVLSEAQWRVRDAVAGPALVGVEEGGAVSQLQLRLERSDRHGERVHASVCTVIDVTGSERAVTLAYCIPLDATGWRWWDDPERSRVIDGAGPFANLVEWYHGVPLNASLYPMAVVSHGDRGLCLAVPAEPPRVVRFLYDPVQCELRAEFDFGLSPIPQHFPSRADARVMVYEVPGRWAFRQALARYYELHPQAFARRVEEGGIWMPFQTLAAIERPQDFGIAFREVAYGDWDTVAIDEQYGVDSYVYVEPQTNWRHFAGPGDKTYDDSLVQLQESALKGDSEAQATLVSGVEREDGRYDLYLEHIPWTAAAPWSVNADPAVPTDGWGPWPNKGRYELDRLADALGWRDAPPVGLDGVYVDSLEGWGVLQNYRKAHWRVTRYPLTFHQETHRACLSNFWGTYAFAKELGRQLRGVGMLLMANDVFHQLWFFAPLIDIAGREYSWFQDGEWAPVPDERFLFLRSMAARRPYLLLMNNDYESGQYMEEYFQRSLFYACYPSMFHGHAGSSRPYFSNPEWYNRDRGLFVKYVPLIRRLDFAGWRPVPYATVYPGSIRVERYGDGATDDLAFSVHNPTDQAQTVTLSLCRKRLRLPQAVSATEWISGRRVPAESSARGVQLRLDLTPGGYAVVGMSKRSGDGSAAE